MQSRNQDVPPRANPVTNIIRSIIFGYRFRKIGLKNVEKLFFTPGDRFFRAVQRHTGRSVDGHAPLAPLVTPV